MQSTLTPYIKFKNNARNAMEFYQSVFGGKLAIATFKDFHASQDPSEDELVMHADLQATNGINLLASDTPDRMEYRPGTNFSMALAGSNEAELTGYFEKLSTGGQVTAPLAKSIWGDTFGMCIDEFGVSWLVNISATQS
jgi:PhnB protein